MQEYCGWHWLQRFPSAPSRVAVVMTAAATAAAAAAPAAAERRRDGRFQRNRRVLGKRWRSGRRRRCRYRDRRRSGKRDRRNRRRDRRNRRRDRGTGGATGGTGGATGGTGGATGGTGGATGGTGGATGGTGGGQAFWPAAYNAACNPAQNSPNGHTGVKGQDCLTCHKAGGVASGKNWLFGGVVWTDSTATTGAQHVEVGVKDGTNFIYACTDSKGLFFADSKNATAPNWATAELRIRSATGEKTMQTKAIQAGTCNASTCHAGTVKLVKP
ncbi:MAG: hypothetical protein U0263_25170 [Polyangiaceae bacterium]